MRSNKYKVLRSVLGLSLSLLMFGVSQKAAAEIIHVNQEDYFDTKNSLIIQSAPDIKEFKVETNVPANRLEVFEKGKNAEIGTQHGMGFFYSGEYKTMHYPNYEKNYRSTGVVISNPDGTEEITVHQSNIGTYQNKAIDLTVRFYDIVYQLNEADVLPNKIFFDFSESPFSGYDYGNARFKVELSFNYTQDKAAVNFSGDSYLTINSLNAGRSGYEGEYANYLNEDTSKPDSKMNAYLAENTNIVCEEITDVGKVFIGDSNNFIDELGSENFIRNSVSFQISGTKQKFVAGSGFGAAWNAFSSATVFNVKPENPVKTVTDESGKNINEEQVVAGQKIVYRIKQKVHSLGVDILQRYTKLEISDPLPEQFVYHSAKLVNDNGKEVDKDGSYQYDKETHTLNYQASSDFLKTMPLNGESYELVVEGTVSEDVRASDVLVNQAKVVINSYEAETNEVENQGSDPVGSFRIYKVTDQLTGFDPELSAPIYEEKPQSDVSYAITTNEEIKQTDGTIVHESGESLGEISTDETGVAEKSGVYAGQYKAVEIAAPIGIQIDPTPIVIDVVAEKDTAIGEGNQKDPLQEVTVVVNKVFEQENGEFTTEGTATFGLYYASDVVIDDETTIGKDTLVHTLDVEKGTATYQGVLIPNQDYYVKEIATTSGYQLNTSEFHFTYTPVSNEAVHVIQLFENGWIDGDMKKAYGEAKEGTEDVVPIKNNMIRKNAIVKSILKEDGTRVEHYDLLKDGETITFEGMAYIGDNASIESIKLLDTLPDGFTLESMRLYDDLGNDVTKQTTYEVDGQAATLILTKEYAESLKRTSLRWVVETTYHYKKEHVGNLLENQMGVTVNEDNQLSNIVTLTPPVIEETSKPVGSFPNTGDTNEFQRWVTIVGAVIFLGVISFWYTRKVKQADEIDKTE